MKKIEVINDESLNYLVLLGKNGTLFGSKVYNEEEISNKNKLPDDIPKGEQGYKELKFPVTAYPGKNGVLYYSADRKSVV